MFSGNDRISARQAFRLLTFDLLGLGTLLVPTVLAKLCGRDGIFSIIIGIFAGLLFLKILEKIVKDMSGNFVDYMQQKLGTVCSKMIEVGYLIYFILLGGYTAYLFSSLVLNNLLREESFELILVMVLLLTGYGIISGVEGRARVYEMLFWFVLIPLSLMLLSAIDEIQTDYWTPVFFAEGSNVIAGSYYVFICISLVFLLPFLSSYVQKKKRLVRAGRLALICSGGIYAVLYLILLGIFGSGALADMDYPAVTLMSTIKISGGFLKRADAFMFGIWFFTLYALLNSAVFYGGVMLENLMESGGRFGFQGKKYGWILGGMLLLTGGVAMLFYKAQDAVNYYERFLWFIGTPFLVAAAVFLALRAGVLNFKGKKTVIAILLVAITMILTGCRTTELENRNFPIEIAVKDTDEFTKAWLDKRRSSNYIMDYSHLKVIILNEDFVEDKNAMEEFLEFLEQKSDVPRNTYVFVAEDAEEVMELGSKLEESVGTYLEERLENVTEVKKKAYPTLGMLYQERKNHLETLFIPYIAAQEDKPEITDYYVWRRGKAVGKTTNEVALLSFFTENQTKAYTLTMENGTNVELSGTKNQISFSKAGEHTITVDVKCNGEIVYQKPENKEKPEELERQIEKYMNTIAQDALTDGIDVTGSYKKMGGYERSWYDRYQEPDSEPYEEELHIVYKVQISWITI